MTTSGETLRTFQRELPVKLNEHEQKIYGRQLAERVNEKALLVERKANWNKEANAGIQKVNVEIARIATAQAKGEELRPVSCAERFAHGMIEIVRLDRELPEVVEVRPADMRDLQPELPGVTDGDDLEETDGDDVGPAGEDDADDDAEPPGEMGTSSTGATVFNGAPDDVDEETEEEHSSPEAKADRKARIAERARKATPKKKSGGKKKRR